MKENRPLISVLMGVYYRREDLSLLERSVRSILAQTYTNFEFLICDRGSSIGACQLLNEFARSDSRIKLVRDENAPTDLAHKLNVCLKCASGEVVARMDDDDVSHSTRFARQLSFLSEHPEIAFVGCNVGLQREGERIGNRYFPEYPQVKDFYFTQPFIHPTLMFRREALLAVNGYSENKRQILCEDYDLLLRLYTAGYRGANIQESLLDYTLPDNVKGNRKMWHRWNETVTRYQRFRELKVLPKALPYVVKPLLVGLFSEKTLSFLKSNKQKTGVCNGK